LLVWCLCCRVGVFWCFLSLVVKLLLCSNIPHACQRAGRSAMTRPQLVTAPARTTCWP
jgi:hypothetical protein